MIMESTSGLRSPEGEALGMALMPQQAEALAGWPQRGLSCQKRRLRRQLRKPVTQMTK